MTVESTFIGISLAVVSAMSLSAGNIWQAQGVDIASAVRGKRSMFMSLIRTRVWLLGTVMFGLAIVLQMGSLVFAPLMLVQPIGVLALVFSIFINAKISGKKPGISVIRAVMIALFGVASYVTIASLITSQSTITDAQLIAVLVALCVALFVAAVVRLVGQGRSQRAPILYVILGGMFSAFVATLGKTVLLRVDALFKGHHFVVDSAGMLTVFCLIGLALASALSIYFTQTAYTCNPSDVVVAGLTVIDPAIAVVLGITILHEASGAPLWSLLVMVLAGGIAIYGVIRLARAETTTTESTSPPDDDASTITHTQKGTHAPSSD